jgi:hypothetical protein
MHNCAALLAAIGLGLGVSLATIAPARAWTPPAVGQACSGLRGGGAPVERVAGNYLGGRLVRLGVVDRKSFQSCFRDVGACERWLAGHARRYPLEPGFASCVAVRLR